MKEKKITDFKEYHKQYYLEHKKNMIQYGCKKVTCDRCHRTVSRNQLLRHQKTKICEKNALLQIERV